MRDAVAFCAALPLVAALAGCAIAPDRSTRPTLTSAALPTLAPSASAQPAELAIERWWTTFGDPELERLVDDALARNLDLVAAAARVREARARLDEVHGAQLPRLDLQVQHDRFRQSADGLPAGVGTAGTSHSAALVARHELDLWGKLASGSEAARQRLLAQEWARASIAWSLSAQLAEAHFTLRAVQRQLEISSAVRASRATTLALRRREQAAGMGSEFDVRRAEAELASTAATTVALARQRVDLEATIALLSGRPLAEITSAEAPRRPLDPEAPFAARLPRGDASAMLLARPDVHQAEAALAAANADVASARAATLPSLTLSGTVGSDARSFANLFSGPAMVWSIAASLAQPLFDGGQLRARVGQANARADEAFAEYRQVVLAAVLDLRAAYANLDLAEQATRADNERVVALERARRLAQLGVTNGSLTVLDLLDAERNAYQAQLDAAAAARDQRIAQVAVFKALGGGTPAPVALAANQP
jgi:multidrug efflux system outer membrane protein